jgi:hypothetical protein
MRHLSLLVLALAAGSLLCAGAEARPRKTHHVAQGRVLTVVKRSFLDSGPITPYGTTNRYAVEAITHPEVPGGGYRNEGIQSPLLPAQFEIPGFSRYQ